MATHRMPALSRRSFLVSATVAAGGGLALGFRLPRPFGEALAAAPAGAAPEINAWIVVHPDDAVTIRVARSEMGQGSFTALPMLVAEELECDWNKVQAEYAPPSENLRRNKVYGSMSTGGSRSIRESHEYLRKAGASGREMLITAAARQWNVPPGECRAAKSVITHVPTGRTLSFGAVAEAAAQVPPPADVKLKDPKDWTLAGTPIFRLEVPDKVMAKPVYGMDVRLPGMLVATVAACPVFGGTLKGYDDAAIRGAKGVHGVVALPDAVAVVADSYWQAKQALDKLPVTWTEGEHAKASSESIQEHLRGGLAASDAAIVRSDGDARAALSGAAKRIEAEYYAPFLAHATMEPQNCTALVTPNKVEVWVPTQNGDAALLTAAQTAGVPPERVEVHKMHLGGGFGRRGAYHDFVRQAVLIAKAMPGRPVKLVWSREEDTRHDYYRPVSMARFSAALGADGMPVAWWTRIAGQSILASLFPERMKGGVDQQFLEGLADMPYEVPNLLVDYAMRNTHVPVGFWRSVNHSQNAFFKESFVDEMAYAAGQDPYAFRRRMLAKEPKQLAVLDEAARRAGWGDKLPAGVYRGIALNEAYGSIAAQVVEASVDGGTGKVRVHRVVCAIDPGHVVNPLTVEMQVESAIVYGMTAAYYGEITLKDGRVEQANFDDYEMVRMADMPRIEVSVVPSGGFWGGVGEPGLPPFAPALCNAIFAATGKRIRSLPLKHHDLRAA